jgi:hypothetical protein
MAKKAVVSLDHLLNRVAGYVSVKGIEYPVLALNAVEYQLYQRVQQRDPSVTMDDLLAIARRLCPALPEDVWRESDGVIVGTLLATAETPIRDVEEDLPNSSGPTTTSQSPASADASLAS